MNAPVPTGGKRRPSRYDGRSRAEFFRYLRGFAETMQRMITEASIALFLYLPVFLFLGAERQLRRL